MTEIPRNEYHERMKRATQEAVERNLDGLLVLSHQGGSLDRYGDVLYLTNHYSPFCYIRNNPEWSWRGFSAVLLPAASDPVLLETVSDYRKDLVAVDDVRVHPRLDKNCIDTIKAKGLSNARLGLVGTDVVPMSLYHQLTKGLPETKLVDADDILENLRMTKSQNELQVIREGCQVGVRAVNAMMEEVKPGKSEAELAAILASELIRSGTEIYNITMASGKFAFQGYKWPFYDSKQVLRKGDLFHFDLWGVHKGYYVDFARTTIVGEAPSKELEQHFETSISGIEAVIEAVEPGVTAEQLAEIGSSALTKRSVGLYSGWGWDGFGHGIGMGWENPQIVKGDTTVIVPMMYMAIEANPLDKKYGIAYFEQDIAVSDKGAEVLTKDCELRWW